MGRLRKTMLAADRIEQAILLIRGRRVMLDADLAAFYGIRTAVLKRAVRRNAGRFPPDFMFQLTRDEATTILRLRCQSGTLKRGTHVKYLPYVFTQEGVAMLSSVLRSKTAIRVNIDIVRSFIKLRELLLSHEALARRVSALEQTSDNHARAIMSIIKELESPKPIPPKRQIGFGRG